MSGHAEEAQMGGRGADRWSGELADWAVRGRTGAVGQTSGQARSSGRANKGMGLGLKGAISPPHFTLGRPVCLPRYNASVQGA